MVRCLLFFIVLSISNAGFCEKPAGFLWYNVPKEDKKQEKRPFGVPFSQLSYSARDKVLAFYTREAWHKAMNHLTVRDMRNYLALQDYWMKRATNTSRIFEKTMLYYPEFHYEVTHPSNSIGVKVSDEIREKKEQIAIQALSKQHG
ncbi:MAG TPA: conjugal transfer protein TraF, partial [Legionellaceae bacterium]|nr:conjugal transfer protein TraF [Legionellaceae bacterium]